MGIRIPRPHDTNIAKAANIRIERATIGENENGYYINGKAVLAEDAGIEVAKHEITHHLRQAAEKEYRAFESYAVQQMKEELGEDGFNERVKLYQTEYAKAGQQLTEEEAIEEVVADFAGDLLTDETKIARIAGEKPTLAKRIIEAIRDFIRRLTNAGANTEDTAELRRAEALWEKALKKAGQNTETVENGKVRYSTKKDALALEGVDWMDDKSSIKDQLTKHADEINKMQPVAVVEYVHDTRESIVNIMLDSLPKIGGQRIKNSGVNFEFEKEGAKSINTHAKTPELRAAAISAPYVAKYGKLIAGQKNHENTGLTTLTFAAPVVINGTKANVGLAIQFQDDGRARAVNVELQDGGKFKINKNEVLPGSSSRVDRYSQGTSLDTRNTSNATVAESNGAVKKNSVRGVKEAADYAAALREQNEILKKQNERLDTLNKQLQKQMTTTGAREVNRKAIKDLSRKLLKDYGSSMKLSELEGKIADVYDRLASGRMDGETWSEETRAIAQEIAENVLTQSNPLYDDMQELYRQIKGKRLKLSENERGDMIKSGLDYNSFRKKYFGSIYLAENGQDEMLGKVLPSMLARRKKACYTVPEKSTRGQKPRKEKA